MRTDRSPDAPLRLLCLCCCLATASVSEAQLMPGFLGAGDTGGHSSVDAASELELLPSPDSVNAASLRASLSSSSPALPIPPRARRSSGAVSSTNTCPYARAASMALRSSAAGSGSRSRGKRSALFGLALAFRPWAAGGTGA